MHRARAHFTSVLRRKSARRQFAQHGAGDQDSGPPDMLLNVEQMFVNEALVQKIFECERDGGALRASEKNLNELLAYHFSTRVEERSSVARELQASLDHDLSVLRGELASFHARTAGAHSHLHAHSATALGQLERAIAAIDRIIADLRPLQLELGLAAAVKLEVDQFRRGSGLLCQLSLDPQLGGLVLPDETLLVLYRALQECLNNVKRHALAKHLRVTVDMADAAICITVSDDGAGFNVDGHLHLHGLHGLQQRIQALGGAFTVEGSDAGGTKVTLSVPVLAVHSCRT